MHIDINGNTLKSLRKRYKANLEAASKMTGFTASQLNDWEQNNAKVSLTDAKKIAKGYHSHWSVFLLHSNVGLIKEPVNHRAGYTNGSSFSSNTMRAYEVARKLLDSSEEIEGQVVDQRLDEVKKVVRNGASAKSSAQKVREIMGISGKEIMTVTGGPYKVYGFWKYHISALGVYISEQQMPEEETKAFLLREKNRAVIVVNKKDSYILSRVFSMLHELGHLVKGESSAACSVSLSASRFSDEEAWCNKFASELLAYDEDVLSNSVVEDLKSMDDPSLEIQKLATKYKVSFTVMLYKLKKHDKVTQAQCTEMRSFFENVLLPKIIPKRDPKKEIRLGRAYYVNKDISKASLNLSREVIEKQIQGEVSYSEAAKLLDTKTKYLEEIKEAVGFGR